MQSSRLLRPALVLQNTARQTPHLRTIATRLSTRPFSTENSDRLKGPVSTESQIPGMEAIKNTIAENLGKIIPGNELASAENQFSLDAVPDLSGKVAVVTGGSEGIGYGCTHTLLKKNVKKLFILSQSDDIAADAIKAIKEEMGEETGNRVVWMKCDLSDWEETGRTAFKIAEQTDRIDILINNAARGIMTYQLARNGVDLHMAINHFGHVVLTSHLLPILKETAKKGKVRIVCTSSNLHEQTPSDTQFASIDELNTDLGAQPQYARSKLAALLYTKYLSRHLTPQHPNILANAIHPGIVETRQSTEHIHEAFPLGGYAMSVGMAPFKKTQFEGAVSTMYAATMTEKSGQYICPPAIVEKGSDKANDVELGERLMDLTWKVVKEKTKSQSADKGCPFRES
ncbi:retinol dehydrogenase 12 [Didymella exigua CBS 183.55]|uniref:Retinol dehydrogenase 12 n=1 Tax=Didymella exigua CBS 183.55 TaxID=1150837 RepID=A0A6A5REY2_9PLEO|nr:retinol dehydrogenase 12 [Didymella exigua CBS 183.55]KAF1926851.1 retinol dehydrogenase 12 [Didymella exigua CBS 183.55]